MIENICHYIPYRNDYHSIHTINFVLETKKLPKTKPYPRSTYRVYYVKSGTGKLHVHGKIIPLKKNDVFITFPDFAHCIESGDDFSVMYISFLGSRAAMILDKLKVTTSDFFFEDCVEICRFCEQGIRIGDKTSDWIAESVLLYTFSHLACSLLPDEKKHKEKNKISLVIKKFIDDNISDSLLCVSQISREISYSPKYISAIFKKEFKIGINEYINMLRIQHACTLMEQGFTSVTDISVQCGFSDAQYFSKVFRKRMKASPREFIQSLYDK